MKVEKVGNRYRVRVQKNKKKYTLTFRDKPTKADIAKALAKQLEDDGLEDGEIKVDKIVLNYINRREQTRSPATIKGYMAIYRVLPLWFRDLKLSEVNQITIQDCINELAVNRSPKTMRNINNLIIVALKHYKPNLAVNIALPQAKRKEPYIPTEDEIKKLLNFEAGGEFEVVLWLGCMGLRRSEVCALELEDIDFNNNLVSINKAVVKDKDGVWQIKGTKTTNSERVVAVPKYVIDLIKEKGYIYKGSPDTITDHMLRSQDKLGFKKTFTFHKLRHYYVSMAHELGIPDHYIMMQGGWRTDNTLRNIYRHALEDKAREHSRALIEFLEGMKKDPN